MFQSTVFCSRFQLIKNSDVSIATKNFPLYSKPKRTTNKAVKIKKTTSKQYTKERHQALKKKTSIYLCTKEKKILPTPENL